VEVKHLVISSMSTFEIDENEPILVETTPQAGMKQVRLAC
jgi:hypothetical protein